MCASLFVCGISDMCRRAEASGYGWGVGASLGRSVPSGNVTFFSIFRLAVECLRQRWTLRPRRPASHIDDVGVDVTVQHGCPCALVLALRPCCKFVAGLLNRRRPATVHLYSARTRPRGHLRCAERRLMVACDWSEHRCAPSFALTEPPDLTAMRFQACAAAH